MKEFDFDELDKAVNSLMVDAKVKGEAISEPEVPAEEKPVLELASLEKPDKQIEAVANTEQQETESQAPASAPLVETTPETPASIADTSSSKPPVTPPRRSGRFMDVVHPSSDMRPGLRAHSSTAISPISASDDAPDQIAEPEVSEVVSAPVDTHQSSEEAAPVFDPIAFQEEKEAETETNDTPEPADAIEEVSAAAIETPAANEQPVVEPETLTATSPFLTDAKVEKRPLNSGISPSTEEDGAVIASEASDDPTQNPQPAEFGSDILAIESGAIETPAVDPAAEEVAKPAYKGVTTTAAPVAQGTVSIAQQYKEQPSSTPEDHEAIYDSAVHPPLSHPAKKRSGWLIVLWIALLLALGGGGAAALYMLKVI